MSENPWKLRDWNRAQDLVRRSEADGRKPTKKAQVTIEEWRDQFLQDATTSRNLSYGTMRLYKLLFRQLNRPRDLFSQQHGPGCPDKVPRDLGVGALTAPKKLERLRSIYKFALRRKMVDENYALDFVAPAVKEKPTLPFPEEEMLRIRKAAGSNKVDPRVGVFILTMRYSGLRISDVAMLSTDSLEGNRLKLYQTKTGVFVSVLIPANVAKALQSVPPRIRNISSGQVEGLFDHRILA